MLHTECFSLTRPRSVIRDDRNRPYLIDNTSMRRISMGVDVISGHSVCGSASGNAISFIHFFLRLWENFDYIRLRIYIFFPLFFWTATDRLPEMFSNSEKKRGYPYLPMGQLVERKWRRELNRSDFQCLIRVKK